MRTQTGLTESDHFCLPVTEFSRAVSLSTEDPGVSAGEAEIEAGVLKELLKMADHLVGLGVHFVGCQKVMHPVLKDFWREKACH